MISRWFFIFPALCLAVATANDARAEEFTLKSGETRSGAVVEINEFAVRLKSGETTSVILRVDLAELENLKADYLSGKENARSFLKRGLVLLNRYPEATGLQVGNRLLTAKGLLKPADIAPAATRAVRLGDFAATLSNEKEHRSALSEKIVSLFVPVTAKDWEFLVLSAKNWKMDFAETEWSVRHAQVREQEQTEFSALVLKTVPSLLEQHLSDDFDKACDAAKNIVFEKALETVSKRYDLSAQTAADYWQNRDTEPRQFAYGAASPAAFAADKKSRAEWWAKAARPDRLAYLNGVTLEFHTAVISRVAQGCADCGGVEKTCTACLGAGKTLVLIYK